MNGNNRANNNNIDIVHTNLFKHVHQCHKITINLMAQIRSIIMLWFTKTQFSMAVRDKNFERQIFIKFNTGLASSNNFAKLTTQWLLM